MTPLPRVALSASDQEALRRRQQRVNEAGTYAQKIAAAKQSFAAKPRALFGRVRTRLRAMCSGNARCVYCEDSLADEIEHIRPKDLYPEQAFAWENYVFACGPCNGPKNNRFAILVQTRAAPPRLQDVTRKRGDPVRRPRRGVAALIDPRVENPVDLLWLDFMSFWYLPALTAEDAAKLRVNYTLEVLGLNQRDDLVRGRQAAYSGFVSRLERFASNADQWSADQRRSFVADFRAERYRGVWEQMKRQRKSLPEVERLLAAVPEALAW